MAVDITTTLRQNSGTMSRHSTKDHTLTRVLVALVILGVSLMGISWIASASPKCQTAAAILCVAVLILCAIAGAILEGPQ